MSKLRGTDAVGWTSAGVFLGSYILRSFSIEGLGLAGSNVWQTAWYNKTKVSVLMAVGGG